MSVPPLVWYGALCVAPAAAFAVIDRAFRAWTGQTPWSPPPTPAGLIRAPRPVERLAADLRRLQDELDRLRRSRGFARHHHMTAVALAYDDVLRDCCRALEVPVSPGPLDDVERLRVEAELEASGLSW